MWPESQKDEDVNLSYVRPKELGAVVVLDERQVVRTVGGENGVNVSVFLQPVAASQQYSVARAEQTKEEESRAENQASRVYPRRESQEMMGMYYN